MSSSRELYERLSTTPFPIVKEARAPTALYCTPLSSCWGCPESIRLLVNPDLGWGPDNWWQSPEQGIDTGSYDYGGGTGFYLGNDGSATLSYNYQDITSGHMNSASSQYKFILEIVHITIPGMVLYLDNVKFSGGGYVENTPEPTTIALLGLGSLALLRRKK